jgi:hypothetical protein
MRTNKGVVHSSIKKRNNRKTEGVVVKRWPEKESCTTQDAVAAGSPSAADGAVQKAPQINQSGRTSQSVKAKHR